MYSPSFDRLISAAMSSARWYHVSGSRRPCQSAYARGLPDGPSGVREASARVSTHAADYLALSDRGRLAVGAFADIAVLDPVLKLRSVIVEGVPVEHLHAA